jgi:anti-sigma-K factor RskA
MIQTGKGSVVICVCSVDPDPGDGAVDVHDVLPALPQPSPLPRALRRRVLRAVRSEPKTVARRRPRPILPGRAPVGWLALAAAMAATAAVVVSIAATRPHERVIPASLGAAQLRIAGGHGELVVAHLPRLPSSRTYEVWLLTGRRDPVPSTLFGVSTRGTADVTVPADLRRVTRLLVTAEPRGGSLHPTTRPVIQLPVDSVSRS